MKYSENAIHIMIAKTYKGIGKAWIVKNINGQEDEQQIVNLLNKSVKGLQISLDEFKERKLRCAQFLENMADFADGVVALGDPDFPVHRGKVPNSEKPVLLFYRGDLNLLSIQNHNVAVIGVLKPDAYTETAEQHMVAHLVHNGACIVSGLAQGCDAIAHKEAVDLAGKTVAILPSTLNNISPATNRKLAEEILKTGGLLISEYYNEPKSKMELSSRYQERDRLQALFSDAIILTASYAKNDLGNDSGSRLAMGYACNYGLPRAVMYDPTTDELNPKYDLNRQIMQEDIRTTVINPQQIAVDIASLFSRIPTKGIARSRMS